MAGLGELSTRLLDVGLGIAILALLVYLAFLWNRNGIDFALARMNLLRRNTRAMMGLSVLGFAAVVIAKGLDLYEVVAGAPWLISEGHLETLSLILVFLALVVFVPVLRVPRKIARPAT